MYTLKDKTGVHADMGLIKLVKLVLSIMRLDQMVNLLIMRKNVFRGRRVRNPCLIKSKHPEALQMKGYQSYKVCYFQNSL